MNNINICIQSGLNVIQQNIDDGLGNFSDKSFDTVIMSQTIQVLKKPKAGSARSDQNRK